MRRLVDALIRPSRRDRCASQALAEFAIVFPIAMIVIISIIVLGMYVFYQQQITNVAREAARFAGVHSSGAACPTSSWRDPQAPPSSYAEFPFHCDGPARPGDLVPWPAMTAHARTYAWGVSPSSVMVNACWSGYLPPGTVITGYPDYSKAGGFPQADYPAIENIAGTVVENQFIQCTIAGTNPVTNLDSLGCSLRMTTAGDDPASDIPGNQVTAYACFRWSPPLAGLFFVPASVTMRAAITEVIQRQQ